MKKVSKFLVILTTIVVTSPIIFGFRNAEERCTEDNSTVEFKGYLYDLFKIDRTLNRKFDSYYRNQIFFKTTKIPFWSSDHTVTAWYQMLNSDTMSITSLMDTSAIRIPYVFPTSTIKVSYLDGSKSIMSPTGLSDFEVSDKTRELAAMIEFAFYATPIRKVVDDTSYVIKCVYIEGKFDCVSWPNNLIVTEINHLNLYDAPKRFPVAFDEFWNEGFDTTALKRTYSYIKPLDLPISSKKTKFKGLMIFGFPYAHRDGPVQELLYRKTRDSRYMPQNKPSSGPVIYPFAIGQQMYPVINDIPEMIHRANDADSIILLPGIQYKGGKILYRSYKEDIQVEIMNTHIESELMKYNDYSPIIYNPKRIDDLYQCLYIEGYMDEIDPNLYIDYVPETELHDKKLFRIDSLIYCNPFYIPEGYLLWSPIENEVVNSYNFKMPQRANIDSVHNELK